MFNIMRLAVILILSFSLGCATPYKRYKDAEKDYERFCRAVLKTSGYKKPPKQFMAQCLSQSFSEHDNVRWIDRYSAFLFGMTVAGLSLSFVLFLIGLKELSDLSDLSTDLPLPAK